MSLRLHTKSEIIQESRWTLQQLSIYVFVSSFFNWFGKIIHKITLGRIFRTSIVNYITLKRSSRIITNGMPSKHPIWKSFKKVKSHKIWFVILNKLLFSPMNSILKSKIPHPPGFFYNISQLWTTAAHKVRYDLPHWFRDHWLPSISWSTIAK